MKFIGGGAQPSTGTDQEMNLRVEGLGFQVGSIICIVMMKITISLGTLVPNSRD